MRRASGRSRCLLQAGGTRSKTTAQVVFLLEKLICRVKGLVAKRETRVCLTLTSPSCRNPFIPAPAKALLLCFVCWEGRKILVPPIASLQTLLLLLVERKQFPWLEPVFLPVPFAVDGVAPRVSPDLEAFPTSSAPRLGISTGLQRREGS